MTDKKWKISGLALRIVHPLGLVCAIFGLLVMLGYAINSDILYRPLSGGPATNPLTALCVIFIGLGLATSKLMFPPRFQSLWGISAFSLTSLRLLDAFVSTHISTYITPFADKVAAEIAQGASNAMGVNSALMLWCLAVALIFHSLRKPLITQILAFFAMGLPMVSMTGYAYGIEHFYGEMSMTTMLIGLSLSAATLAMTAHHGVLKAVLSPHIGGRIARIQVLLGGIVPFLLGWLMTALPLYHDVEKEFGIYIIAISWFIIMLVCFSAIFQEQVDQRRRLAEQALSQAAMTDALTGLANRRRFFDIGLREMTRALLSDQEIWILMIDVDYFKRINDTAGHEMGDKVLIEIGRLLLQSVRASDVSARLGGEEFVVLLNTSSAAGASQAAAHLHEQIKAMEVAGWTDVYGPVTVSIGCASSRGKQDFEQVLAAADAKLYQAKSGGRNQTVQEEIIPA